MLRERKSNAHEAGYPSYSFRLDPVNRGSRGCWRCLRVGNGCRAREQRRRNRPPSRYSSSSHLHISWLLVKCPSSYVGNTPLSLFSSLPSQLFVSLWGRRAPVQREISCSVAGSRKLLSTPGRSAFDSPVPVQGSESEARRLVACLYSLQLYKKDVKNEGWKGMV